MGCVEGVSFRWGDDSFYFLGLVPGLSFVTRAAGNLYRSRCFLTSKKVWRGDTVLMHVMTRAVAVVVASFICCFGRDYLVTHGELQYPA